MSAGVRDIMAGSRLPVLIDGDDGYGDVKNVVHTVAGYEAMGASAIFIEDQRAPKRCGHMAGKSVIETEAMARKLRAAVAARRSTDLFIIARTDARAVHGLDEALRRGEVYLNAGADGLFIEAPQSVEELARVEQLRRPATREYAGQRGRAPILRRPSWRGSALPWSRTPPRSISPWRAMEKTLAELREGRLASAEQTLSFEQFKDITGLAHWGEIEQRFDTAP